MIDPDGYRPNVGIILMRSDGSVFWARRVSRDGWQFPQGGMNTDETPLEAMYRELREETGLNHIRVGDVEIPTDADGAIWLKGSLLLCREERLVGLMATVDLTGQDFHPGQQHRFLAGRFIVEVLVGLLGRFRLLG